MVGYGKQIDRCTSVSLSSTGNLHNTGWMAQNCSLPRNPKMEPTTVASTWQLDFENSCISPLIRIKISIECFAKVMYEKTETTKKKPGDTTQPQVHVGSWDTDDTQFRAIWQCLERKHPHEIGVPRTWWRKLISNLPPNRTSSSRFEMLPQHDIYLYLKTSSQSWQGYTPCNRPISFRKLPKGKVYQTLPVTRASKLGE